MLEVVVPADDLNLLTIEELRVAVGLDAADDSQDERLATLGLRVAAMITAACHVAKGGIDPPTLLNEDLTETFRLHREAQNLYLARRPVGAVTEVTEAGTVLTPADYEIDYPSGQLMRLRNDTPSCWLCGKIVVKYDAGFETVPDGLKAIAAQLAGGYWLDEGTDPQEKHLEIPGLISTDRWVDSGADQQMPADILNALADGGYVTRLAVL